MVERDCSKHTKRVTVKADKEDLEEIRRYGLVAGLLRIVAEYTDGYCAVERAKDIDLIGATGMRFYFRDDEKRSAFKNRIPLYIEKNTVAKLTIT